MDSKNSFVKLLMNTFQELNEEHKEQKIAKKQDNSIQKKSMNNNNPKKQFNDTSNNNYQKNHNKSKNIKIINNNTHNDKESSNDSSSSCDEIDKRSTLEDFVVSLLKFAPKQKMLISELGLKITDTFEQSIKQLSGLKSSGFFNGMKQKNIIQIKTEKISNFTLSFAQLIKKKKHKQIAIQNKFENNSVTSNDSNTNMIVTHDAKQKQKHKKHKVRSNKNLKKIKKIEMEKKSTMMLADDAKKHQKHQKHKVRSDKNIKKIKKPEMEKKSNTMIADDAKKQDKKDEVRSNNNTNNSWTVDYNDSPIQIHTNIGNVTVTQHEFPQLTKEEIETVKRNKNIKNLKKMIMEMEKKSKKLKKSNTPVKDAKHQKHKKNKVRSDKNNKNNILLTDEDATEIICSAILRNFLDGSLEKIMLTSINMYCDKYCGIQWSDIMQQTAKEFVNDMVYKKYVLLKKTKKNKKDYYIVLDKESEAVKKLDIDSLTHIINKGNAEKLRQLILGKLNEGNGKIFISTIDGIVLNHFEQSWTSIMNCSMNEFVEKMVRNKLVWMEGVDGARYIVKKNKNKRKLERVGMDLDMDEPKRKKQKLDIESGGNGNEKIMLLGIELKEENGMEMAQKMIEKFKTLKNKHEVHFHFEFDE